MGKFNSDDHYIYYWGQESLRRNGVVLIVNKRIQNAVLGWSLQNDRMISVRLQGKPFNIIVIQVCAPTINVKEAEIEWFYDDLQDLLELTPKKDILFITGGRNAKVGSQEILGVTGKFGFGMQKWSRAKANRVLPRECTGCSKLLLPTTQDSSTHGHHQMVRTKIRLILFFEAKDKEAPHNEQKLDLELSVAQIMNFLLQTSE